MPPAMDKDAKIACPTPQHLQAELDTLSETLALGEKEETWEKLERALIRFAGVTRGGGYKHVTLYVEGVGRKGVGPSVCACMLSDRGRLSAVATDLVQTLAPRLSASFAPLTSLYLSPLIRLLGRPNKVVLKRSEKCLSTIISHCHLPAIVLELQKGLSDEAAICRRGCAAGIERALMEWDIEVWNAKALGCLEDGLRKMGPDKDPEVRKVGKRIWSLFSEKWPERVEEFSAPLTPTIRRYLDIGHVNGAARGKAPARMGPPAHRPISAASSGSSNAPPVKSHSRSNSHASRPARLVKQDEELSRPRRHDRPQPSASVPASPTKADLPKATLSKSTSTASRRDHQPVTHHVASSQPVAGPSSPVKYDHRPHRPYMPTSKSTTALADAEPSRHPRLGAPSRPLRHLAKDPEPEHLFTPIRHALGVPVRLVSQPLDRGVLGHGQMGRPAQRRHVTAPLPRAEPNNTAVAAASIGAALKHNRSVKKRVELIEEEIRTNSQPSSPVPSRPASSPKDMTRTSPLAQMLRRDLGPEKVDSPLLPVLMRSTNSTREVEAEENEDLLGVECSGDVTIADVTTVQALPVDTRTGYFDNAVQDIEIPHAEQHVADGHEDLLSQVDDQVQAEQLPEAVGPTRLVLDELDDLEAPIETASIENTAPTAEDLARGPHADVYMETQIPTEMRLQLETNQLLPPPPVVETLTETDIDAQAEEAKADTLLDHTDATPLIAAEAVMGDATGREIPVKADQEAPAPSDFGVLIDLDDDEPLIHHQKAASIPLPQSPIRAPTNLLDDDDVDHLALPAVIPPAPIPPEPVRPRVKRIEPQTTGSTVRSHVTTASARVVSNPTAAKRAAQPRKPPIPPARPARAAGFERKPFKPVSHVAAKSGTATSASNARPAPTRSIEAKEDCKQKGTIVAEEEVPQAKKAALLPRKPPVPRAVSKGSTKATEAPEVVSRNTVATTAPEAETQPAVKQAATARAATAPKPAVITRVTAKPTATAHAAVTLPPVRKDRVRLKAPLPAFKPVSTKDREKKTTEPASAPLRIDPRAKTKVVTARVKPESIPLPLSPSHKAILPPKDIPLPQSPVVRSVHASPSKSFNLMASTPPLAVSPLMSNPRVLSPILTTAAPPISPPPPPTPASAARLIDAASPEDIPSPFLRAGLGLRTQNTPSSRYCSSRTDNTQGPPADTDESCDDWDGFTTRIGHATRSGKSVRPKVKNAEADKEDLMEFSASSRPAHGERKDVSTPTRAAAEALLSKLALKLGTPRHLPSSPLSGASERKALGPRDVNALHAATRTGHVNEACNLDEESEVDDDDRDEVVESEEEVEEEEVPGQYAVEGAISV